jgi:hypothetical protein
MCWTTTHGDVKLIEDGKSNDGDVGVYRLDEMARVMVMMVGSLRNVV